MRVYFPVCFTPKNITPCRTKNYIVFTRGWNVFERGRNIGNAMCHVLIVVNGQLDEFSRNNFCAQIIYNCDNIVIGTHGRILSFVSIDELFIIIEIKKEICERERVERKFCFSFGNCALRRAQLCAACTSFARK